jgi:hypothetical protein
MITKCKCKAYDRSSLCQSVCLAQGSILKDLGIVENDGKLNEDAMQDIAFISRCVPHSANSL